jgi:hypothetical protein
MTSNLFLKICKKERMVLGLKGASSKHIGKINKIYFVDRLNSNIAQLEFDLLGFVCSYLAFKCKNDMNA